MSALLAQARARQAAAPRPTINIERECADRARYAAAVASTRPVGIATLAWCDAHPERVGEHSPLVEALRQAMADNQFIHSHLLPLWAALPETVDAGYAVSV